MKSSIIKTDTVLADFLLATCLSTHAEVKLPAIFSDGMVTQQQTNANPWGTATSHKKATVTVSWNGKQYAAAVDKNETWKLTVATPEAGGPYTVTFDDETRETLNNILIDELRLCSGQSNMETSVKGLKSQPVENTNIDTLHSKNPQVRLLMVKRTSTFTPQNDVISPWKETAPASVHDFGATTYYFGRLVDEILDIPVGLVVAAWDGSACEAWMTADWLKAFPEAKIPQTEADVKSKNHTPTVFYNGILHSLTGITMKGVIWHQGEDDWNRAHTYADMFTRLVSGWHAEWKRGDFPSYYCQVAPYNCGITTGKRKKVINSAYLRETQAKVEHRAASSSMAVLLDAGMEKGIHPTREQIAGERLALLTLTKTYEVEDVNGESPYCKSVEIENDTVVVSFEHANMWINGKNCFESKSFRVAGEDKVFYPAKAWIERSKMLVKNDKVSHPVTIRYCFENHVGGDIYCDGLPLGSFRSDDW